MIQQPEIGLPTAETILYEKGMRLDPSSIDGAAGSHIQNSIDIFRGYLQSIVVPGEDAVTQSTPPSRIARFEYVRRWDVNAWATLAAEGPLVIFHAGIPFSLFEYFNALLAHPAILPDLDSAAELSEPFHPLSIDFASITQGTWPSSVSLTPEQAGELAEDTQQFVLWSHYLRRKPRSIARQGIAHQLYITAMHFLFCHELEHIDRGHLEFQHRRNRSYVLSEFAIATAATPIADQAVLELEADLYATIRTLRPYLARKKSGNYPNAQFGGAEAGTAACYRLVLFAIGALFLALEHQQRLMTRKTWWLKIARRFMPSSTSTHPDCMTRLRAALMAARLQATDNDESDIAIEHAHSCVLEDLALVATHLDLDVSRLRAQERLNEAQKMLGRLSELASELADCRSAISDHYFQSGQPVTLKEAQASAKPIDPYLLRDQYLVRYVNGEPIKIPFLHEDAPVTQFLENSCKWEYVGYLDNAFVFAQLALKKANLSANEAMASLAKLRLEEVAACLGTHLEVLEQLAVDHGLILQLGDRIFGDGQNPKSKLHEDVVKDLASYCAIRPRETRTRRRLADEVYLLGDFEGARQHYQLLQQEALSDDERVSVVVGFGNCMVELGKPDQAVACFRDALKIDRTSAYAWENLVICLVRSGRFNAAIEAIDEALETNQLNAEYWFLKAVACKGVNMLSQVRSCNERALSLDPKNTKYLLALGQLMCEEGQFRDAVEIFTRVLEISADSEVAKYRREAALVALGETAAARLDFESVQRSGGSLAALASRSLQSLVA